jgi:hypothetical protein
VIAGDISPWLALVLFAFNFVCVLAAAIVILSLAGRELGIRELLPADRDTSLSRLVAITLLPFLAMYAAFGQVAEAANRLVTQQWVRYGFLSDQQTVLGALYDLATQHLSWLVALLAGIYALRRLLDFIAERTGLRILDLLAVLVECEKKAFRRLGPPPRGIRLAAARFQEAFFGDIDDKYLPRCMPCVWCFVPGRSSSARTSSSTPW